MFLSPTPKGMGGFTESWSDGSPHPAALATSIQPGTWPTLPSQPFCYCTNSLFILMRREPPGHRDQNGSEVYESRPCPPL